jgi:RPA family protein
MGGGPLISSTSSRQRQPALRMFAIEFSQSSLPIVGQGEFDPSFVVSRLGAMTSRMLVAGVIDNMERRDTESGPGYRGRLRDSTGLHMFDVTPFTPELHAEAEEILARFERGDRFLVLMLGRSRHYETEDGGVFTSIRAEGFREIDVTRYHVWLARTADATMRRIDSHRKSRELENSESGYKSGGIPSDLIQGLLKSREHYGEIDDSVYEVAVMRAISMSEGLAPPEENLPSSEPVEITHAAPTSVDSLEGDEARQKAKEIIMQSLSASDNPIDYDTLIRACSDVGIVRLTAEEVIDDLRDVEALIQEPEFGFFEIL